MLTQQRKSKAQRGQSLVEFALTLPMLLIILSGVLDFGRLYFVYIALEDAAAEAALYLSINAECAESSDALVCADPNNAHYRALNSGGMGVDLSTATVNVSRPDVFGVGDTVTVTMDYDFELLTPVISSIPAVNPITLSVIATQTIIRE